MMLPTTKPFVEIIEQAESHRSAGLLVAATIWLVTVMLGFGWLVSDPAKATLFSDTPVQWPVEAATPRLASGLTLMLFAHPRCPCTRASLRELEAILASRPNFASVNVVFFHPRGAEERWHDTDIVRQARGITGVEVAWDEDGRRASQFGIVTSGHVVLYDTTGNLKFSGGITARRGHEGWNVGRAAVIALGRGDSTTLAPTPVFGCGIVGSICLNRDAKGPVQP